MIRSEDDGGAVREDLGEVGGAVPATGEGADTIVAAEVCESSDALGNRTIVDVRVGGLRV